MMLSGRDPKKMVGMILAKASPSVDLGKELKRKNQEAMGKLGETDGPGDEPEHAQAMNAAASAFLDAIESKDSASLAAAFQQLFECCEMAPHEEEAEPSEPPEY